MAETDNARVAGAPVPVTIDGVEYRFSTLSDRDLCELDEWVRSQYLRVAQSTLPQDPAARDAYFAVITKQAMKLSWFSGEGLAHTASLEGIARLMFQSVKKLHPDFTFEKAKNIVRDAGHVREVNMGFKRANMRPSNTKRQTPESVKAKQQSTRQLLRRTSSRPSK